MNTELIEQNVHRLIGAMTGAATTAMVAVGDQLGLYRALADGGPATQDELAARTGTAARYLREWLSQQAAAGFLAYREGDRRYALAAEAAAVLADEASPAFPSPAAGSLASPVSPRRSAPAPASSGTSRTRLSSRAPRGSSAPATPPASPPSGSLPCPGWPTRSPPAAGSPTSAADTAWPPS